MTALPIISGAQCVAAPQKIGYRIARQKGSDVRLVCPGRTPVTVPMHSELDCGTLRGILRTADISVEQVLDLLR